MGSDSEHPQQVLESLKRHVRSPPNEARRILRSEQAEVTAERDAFEAFAERVAAIDPVVEAASKPPLQRRVARDQQRNNMKQVRTVYRETVMDVPHYDAVYGEPLEENMATELGADLAGGVCSEPGVPLTASVQRTLERAAARATAEREEFIQLLDREIQSIDHSEADLSGLLEQLDSTTIPAWYRETFADRLDDLVHRRQEQLRTDPALSHCDEHELCTYLYQDESWTYPVLTAVTRLLETLDLPDDA